MINVNVLNIRHMVPVDVAGLVVVGEVDNPRVKGTRDLRSEREHKLGQYI